MSSGGAYCYSLFSARVEEPRRACSMPPRFFLRTTIASETVVEFSCLGAPPWRTACHLLTERQNKWAFQREPASRARLAHANHSPARHRQAPLTTVRASFNRCKRCPAQNSRSHQTTHKTGNQSSLPWKEGMTPEHPPLLMGALARSLLGSSFVYGNVLHLFFLFPRFFYLLSSPSRGAGAYLKGSPKRPLITTFRSVPLTLFWGFSPHTCSPPRGVSN
jgi:hypothetical protein